MPKLKVKKLSLEEGMYGQAKQSGVSFERFLEDHYAKEAGEESPYMGKSPLEVLLIKRQLKAAGKDVPLTAVEKQMLARGIKTFGMNSDPVAKFFSTADSAVLFPAFISTNVLAGALLSSLVMEFAARTEVIEEVNYQKVTLQDTEADRQLREVGEGDKFPAVEIKLGDEMVRLKKFGRYLKASYEALKTQKSNVVALMLQRIGMQIGIDDTDAMLTAIVNGDGNSNGAATTVKTATAGSIVVADVINFATGAPSPYKVDKFVGRKALLQEYYATLAGMSNPSDQFGFVGISLPRSYEWDRSVVTADTFIGVDSRNSFVHLSGGAVMVESEKIIRQQISGTAVSVRSGQMIIDKNAAVIFDETWV